MYISQACVTCARVCVLSLALFLFSLRSGGSNVCYFFYTWPCLFWQNLPEEVGWCLPPSACLYLPVWSGPVWSNACRQPCAFFFCFVLLFSLVLSFLFLSLMTGMDGIPLSLPFSSAFFTPLPLSLCAPPPSSFLHLYRCLRHR